MNRRMAGWGWIGVAVALALACGGDDSTDPQFTGNSARIVVRDTTLLTGDGVNFLAEVEYVFGPGAPANIFWSVTDTSVVTLDLNGDGSAFLTAKKPGTSKLIAFINKKFTDTSSVTVVATGSVRWRQDLVGAARLNAPAVDDSGNVYVVNAGSGAATLVAYSPSGVSRFSVASCAAPLAPSVDPIGNAWSTGPGCSRRHTPAGTVSGTSALGTADGGLALAANNEVLLLHTVGTAGAGAIALSRLGIDGVEKWRDTLRSNFLSQMSAPALATNGDVFFAWRSTVDSTWMTRVTGVGVVKWTMPVPTATSLVTPAVLPNRIYVTRLGGLMAFDTAGAVVWSRQFRDANAAASLTEPSSSPVVDGTGAIYVQTAGALYSYAADGTLRWFADSLGAGAGATATTGVGAPSILVSLALVVACGGEVCIVGTADGSLKSRSALGGGVAGAIGVGPDGTQYATRAKGSGSEIVALWSRTLPVEAGWPTEGHDMARTRRQP